MRIRPIIILLSFILLSASLQAETTHWLMGKHQPLRNYEGYPDLNYPVGLGALLVREGLHEGDLLSVTLLTGTIIFRGAKGTGRRPYSCLADGDPHRIVQVPVLQFTDQYDNVLKTYSPYEVTSTRMIFMKSLLNKEIVIPPGAKKVYASWPATGDIWYDGTCDFKIKITKRINKKPICKINALPHTIACGGAKTNVSLDGSGSSDPEGKALSYSWNTNCSGTFQNANSSRTTFSTQKPGHGQSLHCWVSLTVSDGEDSVSCKRDVRISACELDCLGVPNGNAQIDKCGVCNGNGRSCLDCAGVPHGNAKKDLCGVCNGYNSCLDCRGVPYGGARKDKCGVCNGNNSCLDCAGVPHGSAKKDACGICNGYNACFDCAGEPYGKKVIDQCGVCGGDGSSCLDCAGSPFGNGGLDKCGVCNGTNSCVDCFGVPYGQAVVDKCGVCDGDGTSCQDCDDMNIQEEQDIVDVTSRELLDTVNRSVKKLRKRSLLVRHERFAQRLESEAAEIYKQSWGSIYSLPAVLVAPCTDSDSCVTKQDVADMTDIVNDNAERMTRFVAAAVRRTRKVSGRRRVGQKLINRAQDQKGVIERESKTLRTFDEVCE